MTPDPDCRFCHGEGSFMEDVAGDGGPRMQVACECTDDGEDEKESPTLSERRPKDPEPEPPKELDGNCPECGCGRYATHDRDCSNYKGKR